MAKKAESKSARQARSKQAAPEAQSNKLRLSPCPVVGFGASAGGLEAMTEVLHAIPTDLGMAIGFIQHLDPKHTSILSQLFARVTKIPVREATNGTPLEPNRLYTIAPNTSIAIKNGVLMVEPRPPNPPHMPIDRFFKSLAED